MKKNSPCLSITMLLFLFLLSCKPKETTFNIKSENFGPNSVIEFYSIDNSKPLLTENIKNESQSFKVKPDVRGYGRMVINLGTRSTKEFLIYLDGSDQELTLNAMDIMNYPISNSNTQEIKELIEFYKLQISMSKNTRDSLKIALKRTETEPRETIEVALNEYEEWQDKSKKVTTSVIKSFATSHPSSMLTPILIERFGSPESYAPEYRAIIKTLSPEVKESKQIKTLSKEIDRIEQMQPGQKMAHINGKNRSGQSYDPKILKKINVFICWMSYERKSRQNNPGLVALYKTYKDQDVEFIGISYDKQEKWWKSVIKDDGLEWPQYADLLGSKSPNPGNLSNYRSPYIFITDISGIILSSDIPLENLNFEIGDWLAKAK